MSDIVERLLSDKWQPSVDLELLCVEAAGEIKRLRAALRDELVGAHDVEGPDIAAAIRARKGKAP